MQFTLQKFDQYKIKFQFRQMSSALKKKFIHLNSIFTLADSRLYI